MIMGLWVMGYLTQRECRARSLALMFFFSPTMWLESGYIYCMSIYPWTMSCFRTRASAAEEQVVITTEI
jgi:hypothetical protein